MRPVEPSLLGEVVVPNMVGDPIAVLSLGVAEVGGALFSSAESTFRLSIDSAMLALDLRTIVEVQVIDDLSLDL